MSRMEFRVGHKECAGSERIANGGGVSARRCGGGHQYRSFVGKTATKEIIAAKQHNSRNLKDFRMVQDAFMRMTAMK